MPLPSAIATAQKLRAAPSFISSSSRVSCIVESCLSRAHSRFSEKFTGGGLTGVPGSAAKDQLRFRVRALYADGLPAAFSGRKVAEYPNLESPR